MSEVKSIVVRLIGVIFNDIESKESLMNDQQLRQTEYHNEFEV